MRCRWKNWNGAPHRKRDHGTDEPRNASQTTPFASQPQIDHAAVLGRYIVKCFKQRFSQENYEETGRRTCLCALFNRQAKDDQCRDRKDAHRNAEYS